DIDGDLPPAQARYVETDGDDANYCSDPANPCETIQRAVNLAGSGETVNVGEGEFTGQVIVDGKDVTIKGEGDEETTIESPAQNIMAVTHVNPNNPAGNVRSVVAAKNGAALTVED